MCLRIVIFYGIEKMFSKGNKNKICMVSKTLFCYKFEYNSVRVPELMLYEYVLKIEDAKCLNLQNSLALIRI